jgi:hypothetical protein
MLARSPLLLCFVACLCVLTFFTGAVARGQSAQIAGTITDPSKAAIQNASLEVIDSSTRVQWQTKSNGESELHFFSCFVCPGSSSGGQD